MVAISDRLKQASVFKSILPRSLLGRSVMIIVTPLILLQLVVTSVFYDSHWDTVTKRLARGVAGDIAAIISMMEQDQTGYNWPRLFDMAQENMQLKMAFDQGARLPEISFTLRQTLVDRNLGIALAELVKRPFLIDTRSLETEVEIHVQMDSGVLQIVAPRRRLFTSTTYVVILWMVGTSLALFSVAALFMRSQVKPIRRLAAAAEAFGKGRDSDEFAVEGASEVRQAATAFTIMRDRIRRQITQRTDMLAGVSHDLRTPLTRMKLALAMMGDGPEVGDLKADVAEMEKMVGGYLDLCPGRGPGGDGGYRPRRAAAGCGGRGAARRRGDHAGNSAGPVRHPAPGGHAARPRQSHRQRPALCRATSASPRIARPRRSRSSSMTTGRACRPRSGRKCSARSTGWKSSRNPETGGIGLGLTIARDVARGHGGDLILADSPMGGLRAILRLPV